MALSTLRSWRPSRSLLAGAGLHLLVSIPLVVALIAFNRPQWHPIADLAQSELRVRDVGTRHSPLVGLAGRIGPWTDPGSHPGPLSFWALAPVYRLLGGTAFAFSASAVFLHGTAYGLALWIAHRRGGVRLMLAVGAAGILLVRAYGAVVFLEPWNPYLPVTWWLVLLLAAWSVLDDDPPMLVVAVAAGSFCAQTHLPYLGLVGGLGGALLLASLWWIWRGDPSGRARRIRYLVIGALVGLVLWIPPLIDQIDGTGNLSRIRDSLQEPDSDPVGVVTGTREVVERFGLDIWATAQDVGAAPASASWNLSGLLVLAVWLMAAVLSWSGRVGSTTLRRLHGVLAVGLGLALVASSRINGELWYYLYLWVIGLAALTLVAIGWTGASLVAARLPAERRPLLDRAAVIGPVAAGVVLSLLFLTTAPSAEPSRPDLSGDLGVVADDTVAALRSGDVRGGGADGRYLVKWIDPITIGSQGIGLVDELERAGFDAGVEKGHRVGGTRHRVISPTEATALVQLVVGADIADWQAKPNDEATEVAYLDPRTPAQQQESNRLAERVTTALTDRGLTDLAATWATNVFTASLDATLPPDIRADMLAYLDLGAPIAIFVADPALAA